MLGGHEDQANLCIGFLGAEWWGSDARALGAQLRKTGQILIERHYEDFLPTKWRSLPLRVLRRLLRPLMAAEYNRSVKELLQIEALDFLLVFKGMLLAPETLRRFRDRRIACYCVYPDVSFHDHGGNIWNCLPLYDCVFTTKAFHLEDQKLRGYVRELKYVPHGFDPEVHRPIERIGRLTDVYGCDCSFVGCWSPKKEIVLAEFIEALPEACLRIWGPSWGQARASVRSKWQGRGAYGDELAVIYSCSKINLGLLSEAGGGALDGDRTTARTWQIPASGGFLLHEDTAELREGFSGGVEVGVFETSDSLVRRVREYLGNAELREQVRKAGYVRCQSSGYTYRKAAEQILEFHSSRVSRS